MIRHIFYKYKYDAKDSNSCLFVPHTSKGFTWCDFLLPPLQSVTFRADNFCNKIIFEKWAFFGTFRPPMSLIISSPCYQKKYLKLGQNLSNFGKAMTGFEPG